MGPSGKKDYGTMSEINVTPLVDVMLVLLIIFMVTAPMLQQGVDVDLPQTKAAQEMKVDKERLVVTVSKKKQVYINKTAFSVPELQAKLASIVEKNPGKEVFLRADKTVAYGFVVQVMAAIKDAGISKLGMVTEVSEIKD